MVEKKDKATTYGIKSRANVTAKLSGGAEKRCLQIIGQLLSCIEERARGGKCVTSKITEGR